MIWTREVEDAPLNNRAWICQEHFLSRRNLHFGKRQIFWECGELSANEWFPLGVESPQRPASNPTDIKQLASQSLAQTIKEIDALNSPFKVWDDVLQNYTARKLTYPQDKLAAIIALAKRWASINPDQYLAGYGVRTWKLNCCGIVLLWRADHPDGPYIAPSWFWASVDGTVSRTSAVIAVPGIDIRTLAHVLDAGTELAGDNSFGQVKSRFVTLKGHLARVTPKDGNLGLDGDSMGRVSGVVSPTANSGQGWAFAVYGEKTLEAMMRSGTTGNSTDLCALFIQERYWTRNYQSKFAVSGIVLAPTDRKDVYRRLGMLSAPVPQSYKDACQHFNSHAESGLTYEDDGKGGLSFTVTLV